MKLVALVAVKRTPAYYKTYLLHPSQQQQQHQQMAREEASNQEILQLQQPLLLQESFATATSHVSPTNNNNNDDSDQPPTTADAQAHDDDDVSRNIPVMLWYQFLRCAPEAIWLSSVLSAYVTYSFMVLLRLLFLVVKRLMHLYVLIFLRFAILKQLCLLATTQQSRIGWLSFGGGRHYAVYSSLFGRHLGRHVPS